LNKSEEDSRRETGTVGRLIGNFRKHPDVSTAAKVGDPPLVDPTPVSATDVVQQATRVMRGNPGNSGKNTLGVEAIGSGAPAPDEPAPRSDTPPSNAAAAPDASAPPTDSGNAAGPGELTPNVAPDANELTPNVAPDTQTLPPPQQVNEIQNGASSQPAAGEAKPADAASSADQQPADESTVSSSKHKKKKGLKKIIPF
jgi:outer membrane protein assembly factor BamD